MRICPTNVIHPAAWQAGVEGWWTPMLDFRLGSSGCRFNCVACGQICPTAAIQPLTVAQRSGLEPNGLSQGPVRLGTAFVDRGRCLPWAMDTPCIVCQENCPVSPKAIFTRTIFQPLRDGSLTAALVQGNTLTIANRTLKPDQYATGDYFCRLAENIILPVKANSDTTLTLDGQDGIDFPSGAQPRLVIRLQQPYVDPRHCIGCGVCEHECPVHGRRAIRVTAENETRHPPRRLLLSG
jgi:ferredoxin